MFNLLSPVNSLSNLSHTCTFLSVVPSRTLVTSSCFYILPLLLLFNSFSKEWWNIFLNTSWTVWYPSRICQWLFIFLQMKSEFLILAYRALSDPGHCINSLSNLLSFSPFPHSIYINIAYFLKCTSYLEPLKIQFLLSKKLSTILRQLSNYWTQVKYHFLKELLWSLLVKRISLYYSFRRICVLYHSWAFTADFFGYYLSSSAPEGKEICFTCQAYCLEQRNHSINTR